MLRTERNALRVGDRVLVHDDDDLGAPLTEGTISILQSQTGRGNDLAIRLAAGAGPVQRPRAVANALRHRSGNFVEAGAE